MNSKFPLHTDASMFFMECMVLITRAYLAGIREFTLTAAPTGIANNCFRLKSEKISCNTRVHFLAAF